MSTNTRNRVQKGVSTGGQFAQESRSEDGSITLEVASRSALVTYPGASIPLAMELNEGGVAGTLSLEDDVDDNLPHSTVHPQQSYVTPAGRQFTIGTLEDGQIEVAPSDMRDDDGYFTVEGPADDPADVVKSAVRQAIAEGHADGAIQLPEELEMRDTAVSIDSETGRARLEMTLSGDDGEFTLITFDPSDQSFTAESLLQPAEGEVLPTSDELLDQLDHPITAEAANDVLQRVREDRDTDDEMYDAISAGLSHEPWNDEQQVPEALLREYFHPDHADVLDVRVSEGAEQPTVVIDVQDDADSERYAVTADLEAGTFEVTDNSGSAMARGAGAVDALERFGLPTSPELYRRFHREFLEHSRS